MIFEIPKPYINKLSLLDTQIAIKLAKDTFEKRLSQNLNLIRVSAPLFVRPETGLNDYLNGKELPVKFHLPNLKCDVEIVQSLAKWKRYALGKYRFSKGQGLYTDMNAIRPNEDTDNLHSIYVDQWDWEIIIDEKERNQNFLKEIINKIVLSLNETDKVLKTRFPKLSLKINEEVFFITSEELLKKYPTLTPKEREDAICREKKLVFIIGIGDILSDGSVHDLRAPDYDDWSLNGDLLIWYPILNCAVELMSMGIRVDAKSLREQLHKANNLERLSLPFHQDVLNNNLPLTIGGGIGQSRLCLILLEKFHLCEVQSSTWKEEDIKILKQIGVNIL
ncbi:MAG TPA: aspartate--ammonia ligase [Acholeplasmataceae bacterium]|jgi:aspartate--ammonia ligase|nr:aspartate--ammonia ligase [Acholeplasmataceae bacterium]